MSAEQSQMPVVALTLVIGAVGMLLGFLFNIVRRSKDEIKEEKSESSVTVKKKPPQDHTEKILGPKKPKLNLKQKKSSQLIFSHPWLASSLKAHGSQILDMDFSQNGKYLITVAEDRSAMIWSVKDFTNKEHRFIRANIELDHATRVRFSPDTKAFLVSLANENILRIYRIGKKDDGTPGNITAAFNFPKYNSTEILNIGVASNGRFIMVGYSNTTILVTNIKGEILSTIDTHQVNNSLSAISFCGRFIGSSGFTSDVKVWEVCFDKSHNYKEVNRAFELKGHTAGVKCFCFNADSSRMASASKDGTWKFWDTDVQYQKQQEPYLLYTGKFHSDPTHIALSPDGRTVAMSYSSNILICNTVTKEEEMLMEYVHQDRVGQLSFNNNGKYLVSIGDKHALVFNNITGYRAIIADLQEKLQKSSSRTAMERIQKQIDEAKAALETVLPENSEKTEKS